MSVVAGERVIPEAFEISFERLRKEILRQIELDE
jgi:hypothetical protein